MTAMTRGKNICKQLKEVRKRIAEENGIPLEIKECTYKGECRGTCPRCEAEVRYLENALADKLSLGKVATIAGLSLGLAAGCGQPILEGEEIDPNYVDTFPDSTDTVQPADTAKPIWREPDDALDRIVAGDVMVLPLDSAFPPESQTPNNGTQIEEELVEGEASAMFGIEEVEEVPEFPGGLEALEKYLKENIQYPQESKAPHISGTVFISFTVDTDGTIKSPVILHDIGCGCGQAALRVVKQMPRWKPGKSQGKTVPVQFNLPVGFYSP